MTTAGKLTVGADGKLTGPAHITYNDPFPCVNGSWGSGSMMGVLEHTMVGELSGTVAWFNNPQAQASAQFCIGQDGSIVQMGPIGLGWIAWHAAEANPEWYGVEFADAGNPDNPLTDAQLTAGAQVVECLSGEAGFPLQISGDVNTRGFGTHGMGGVAWGNHPGCPGSVRAAQRAEIIKRALAIRGAVPAPVPKPGTVTWAMWPAGVTLREGTRGDAVRVLQTACRYSGIAGVRGITVDGDFGTQTLTAVRNFQHARGLKVDGVAGPLTRTALEWLGDLPG